MLVKVKTVTNRDLDITTLEPTNTIAQLKEAIEVHEGIPVAQQRIIYGGKALADEKSLDECRIKPGDMVHMILALRAGCI